MPNRRQFALSFLYTAGALSLIGLLLISGLLRTAAQGGTTPGVAATSAGPIFVIRAEPRLLPQGKAGVVSVYGGNFSSSSTIRLVGWGLIATSFINQGALTGAVPDSIPEGQYGIEVIDPVGGTAFSPDPLIILPAPTTPTPPPTPTPIPTLPPGQPVLVVESFRAEPEIAAPGQLVTLYFEVGNQGNRTARGINVSIDPAGKFLPTGGVASLALPDVRVGQKVSGTLTVVPVSDAPAGPNSVPVNIAFIDAEGKTYATKAAISVTVIRETLAAQVSLSAYSIDPDPVIPGKAATLRATISNRGNDRARGVSVRLAGENSVLLAGPLGSNAVLGDLNPGEARQIEMPMVVSTAAKPGPQPQGIVIASQAADKTVEISASLTINVARLVIDRPLLLLQRYSINREVLRPGQEFTLTLDLINAGTSAADKMLVTFGTVETTGPTPDGSGGDGGGVRTSPSDNFAPLGTGGSQFIGDVEVSNTPVTVTQTFLVNGTLTSGIYGIPVTLTYTRRSDGAQVQESLRASVAVVAPPQVQIRLTNPLPEAVNVGEPIRPSLTLTNTGEKRLSLTRFEIAAENGTVIEGARGLLNNLNSGEEATVEGAVSPDTEGVLKVKITIYYIDELRQEANFVEEYSIIANAAPPPIDETPTPPIEETPTPTPTPSPDSLLRRLLLGLLGLGS